MGNNEINKRSDFFLTLTKSILQDMLYINNEKIFILIS